MPNSCPTSPSGRAYHQRGLPFHGGIRGSAALYPSSNPTVSVEVEETKSDLRNNELNQQQQLQIDPNPVVYPSEDGQHMSTSPLAPGQNLQNLNLGLTAGQNAGATSVAASAAAVMQIATNGTAGSTPLSSLQLPPPDLASIHENNASPSKQVILLHKIKGVVTLMKNGDLMLNYLASKVTFSKCECFKLM